MLEFFLDQVVRNMGGGIGEVFYYLLECVSFAGIFIILFALFQGVVLKKWHYSEFILGIIILGLVGIEPGWKLLLHGFPPLSNIFRATFTVAFP